MLQFTVDEQRCQGCGLCVDDCLSGIIGMNGDGIPSIPSDKEADCVKCQHCLAVCPEAAISIFGKSPEDSLVLPADTIVPFDKMSFFVRARRSFRHYKQENVDRALIDKLLTTLCYAPTGVNACELTFSVIDDIREMERFQNKVIAAFRAAGAGGKLPGRYSTLGDLPDEAIKARLFRKAPHALVASAPPDAPCAAEDVPIAIAYFDLLAQTAGLGSLWWGFLRILGNLLPEVKDMLGIPPDHIFSAALFGYPDVQYARTVQRDGAEPVKRLSFSR